MITLEINSKAIEVEEGTTVLEAAKKMNIKIPTLCHMDLHDIRFMNKHASCRVCLVEQEDSGKLIPACATFVKDGMKIKTETARAVKARRTMVELLLSDHPNSCLTCARNLDCELQKLASDLGVRSIKYQGEQSTYEIDDNSHSIVRDANKCILCKRCETMCNEIQTVGALTDVGRGFNTYVGSAFNEAMYETTCTFCGQCLAVCPTGALTEVNNTPQVWDVLHSDKTVIVQVAPAVRVALGEEFGMEPGIIVTGKMINALKYLGFDKVFDTNFAADLTIMEEASEFVHRLNNGGKLPILTSCCPSWVNFFEHQFTDFLDIPSTCKSPHEMFGAIAKSYLAQKLNIDPKDMALVSVMPCVAKKYEAARPELGNHGTKDVDYVITTRELAHMIKEAGINFGELGDAAEFDNPMGASSGAGVIFGATGGVIEATVRTAYEWITGNELPKLEFEELRGLEGIKQTTVDIDGRPIRIAVANGLGNTRRLLNMIRDNEAHFDAIEVMACPGGCVGGAGQPYHKGNLDVIRKRAQGIYKADRDNKIRKSHENPMIIQLYKEFLGEPYSEKAHELLHTTYTARPRM